MIVCQLINTITQCYPYIRRLSTCSKILTSDITAHVIQCCERIISHTISLIKCNEMMDAMKKVWAWRVCGCRTYWNMPCTPVYFSAGTTGTTDQSGRYRNERSIDGRTCRGMSFISYPVSYTSYTHPRISAYH